MKNKFHQPLLEKDQNEYPRGVYECFPAFPLGEGKIFQGYHFLADEIKSNIGTGLRVLVVDGFQGVAWDIFRNNLSAELKLLEIKTAWIDIAGSYAEGPVILERSEPFLGGDDRIFGTHYPFGPEIFFHAEKVADIRIKASIARGKKSGELTIIYGCGSALVELWDRLWYLDMPKDYSQELVRQGKISNFGDTKTAPFEKFYKRAYFVEWPALNRLKRQLLPQMDLLIDGQNIENPGLIYGSEFRSVLSRLSESPFRVRPWFYPGPWGGKFMQGHMALDPEQPNFAWSFELIVPENGIIIESGDKRMEFSFDMLMFQENRRVLGEDAAQQFKYEWPIRLDYLDTVDGGNLSTQVHPRPDYIRNNFGETYTQDETYYIITAKPDARVYLGLTETCDPAEFREVLEQSARNGSEVDIDKYVNSESSKPHDLFLIPNGTVHCSGEGNLVLEISATPYIFTFKIYDYVRRDLQGKLRPINIERAFENIRFDRRKKWVQENLLAKPKLVENGAGWKIYQLYNNPLTFYAVYRAEFEEEFNMENIDSGYAVNLVEGEKVDVIAQNGRTMSLKYIESMLIPAAAGKIRIINRGQYPCKLVLVKVKPGIGKTEALNTPQDG